MEPLREYTGTGNGTLKGNLEESQRCVVLELPHEIGEEAEVAVYKCKSRVIDAVGIRIHVLVEAIQPSICPKVLHYGS